MPTRLLEQLERLPEYRTRIAMEPTGREQKKIQRIINQIIKSEPIIEDIIIMLETQREDRDALGGMENLRQYDPIHRHNYLATKMPHSIENFIQLAFSDPVDYRINKKNTGSNAVLAWLVIDPERISDDFMDWLWLMNDEEKRLPYQEKIQKKISAIPKIKAFLSELIPVSLWPRRHTGRISMVLNRESPYFWKYLVFQEITDIDNSSETKRPKESRKVIPHVYHDHYSLLRSQKYALKHLEDKKEFLEHIRDNIAPEILLVFASQSEQEKKQAIAGLIEKLSRKLSYNEQRALKYRIEKIAFTNIEQDRQRLIGACNDIIKEIDIKLQKNKEIGLQLEWLRQGERMNRKNFEAFYQHMMESISQMAPVFDNIGISQLDSNFELEWVQAHKLLWFWKKVSEFTTTILPRIPMLWHPFEMIHSTLSDGLAEFQRHRSLSSRRGSMWISELRITISFILKLKKIYYSILSAQIRHHKKIRGNTLSETEQINLRSKIKQFLFSLDHIKLLKQVHLREKIDQEFSVMRSSLEWVLKELSEM